MTGIYRRHQDRTTGDVVAATLMTEKADRNGDTAGNRRRDGVPSTYNGRRRADGGRIRYHHPSEGYRDRLHGAAHVTATALYADQRL